VGKVVGTDAVLYMKYGTEWLPIACARSMTFELNTEFIETSVINSGTFRTYIPSAKTFSGSLEGVTFLSTLDPPDANNQWAMGNVYDAIGALMQVRFYEQDLQETHFLQKECYIYIETISESSSFDNITTFSITFKGTGEPTITYGEI
jgi:hypothetical protein